MADGNPFAASGLLVGSMGAPVIGVLAAHDERGLLVQLPGEVNPVVARTVIELDRDIIAESIATRRGVLLAFENGRAELPIIIGLLREPEPPLVAEVDGERVEIVGNDEIVLRCGRASITLRRNGRVVIRGTYVETRASGINRIRGGSVAIN
jgi:hypothetical protein